jgi:hypothetical protein
MRQALRGHVTRAGHTARRPLGRFFYGNIQYDADSRGAQRRRTRARSHQRPPNSLLLPCLELSNLHDCHAKAFTATTDPIQNNILRIIVFTPQAIERAIGASKLPNSAHRVVTPHDFPREMGKRQEIHERLHQSTRLSAQVLHIRVHIEREFTNEVGTLEHIHS